jgi:hypothetical protein
MRAVVLALTGTLVACGGTAIVDGDAGGGASSTSSSSGGAPPSGFEIELLTANVSTDIEGEVFGGLFVTVRYDNSEGSATVFSNVVGAEVSNPVLGPFSFGGLPTPLGSGAVGVGAVVEEQHLWNQFGEAPYAETSCQGVPGSLTVSVSFDVDGVIVTRSTEGAFNCSCC